jgi:AGZA family xanthine/uracil permease-like MFS transporter
LVGIASFKDPIVITFLIGLFVTAVLIVRQTTGGIIIGIVLTTLLAIPIGRWWGDASAVNFGNAQLVTWQGVFPLLILAYCFS